MNWKTIILISMLFGVFELRAHQYYFGFAEVEYHEKKQELELTLIFSAHDLQDVLRDRGVINKNFESLEHSDKVINDLSIVLLKDFEIRNKIKPIRLIAVDFELTKNGLIQFYFKAEEVELDSEFEVLFSSLMDVFEQQQNKITYINNRKKQTAVFLQHQQTQKLTK